MNKDGYSLEGFYGRVKNQTNGSIMFEVSLQLYSDKPLNMSNFYMVWLQIRDPVQNNFESVSCSVNAAKAAANSYLTSSSLLMQGYRGNALMKNAGGPLMSINLGNQTAKSPWNIALDRSNLKKSKFTCTMRRYMD